LRTAAAKSRSVPINVRNESTLKLRPLKKNSVELSFSFFLSSLSLSLSLARLAEILNLSIARIPRECVDHSRKCGTRIDARATHASDVRDTHEHPERTIVTCFRGQRDSAIKILSELSRGMSTCASPSRRPRIGVDILIRSSRMEQYAA